MATSHRTFPVPAPGDHITTHPDDPVFTMVGEWVALAPISDRAARLYWLLRAHVNRNRTNPDGTPNEKAWPTQKRLAAMLRVSKRQTVGAALKELVDIGAVVVEEERYANGMRRRNKYLVRLAPPPGYDGWLSTNDFELPDEDTDPTGANVEVIGDDTEKPQVSPTSATADLRRYAPADINQTKKNQTKKKSSPPVRHHADAWRSAPPHETKPLTPREERRRWEMDGVSSWLTLDNPYLIDDICNYVDSKWGCAPGVRQQVESMAWRLKANGRPVTGRQILNTALKASRPIGDDEPRDPRAFPGSPFTPIADMPAAERALYDPAWFDDDGPEWRGPDDNEEHAA